MMFLTFLMWNYNDSIVLFIKKKRFPSVIIYIFHPTEQDRLIYAYNDDLSIFLGTTAFFP